MAKNLIRIMLVCVAAFTLSVPVFAGEYKTTVDQFTYDGMTIPAYDGDPSEQVNGNAPRFTDAELVKQPSVYYGDLDGYGRCTPCFGSLNKSLMPTHSRGSISSVYPTGWVQAKYDIVSGGWLYNRCHLIGWQLTGADLDTMSKAELSKNLITGTRFLNVGDGQTGMVEYENEVATYLRKNNANYVAYRVIPVFQGNDLLASGVLMEGQSIGANSVRFCVFCYNVQPGIAIDYETGKNRLASAMPENIPITRCSITVDPAVKAYTGRNLVPSIHISDGDKALKEGVDYKLSYRNNIYPGRATVVISGIGGYKGTKNTQFIIAPDAGAIKKIVRKKKALKITASVDAPRGVSGYQLAYKYKKKKWITRTQQGRTFTVKKLKRKAPYTVKVRAYTVVGNTKYYGQWSTVRKVRTK